MLNAQQARLKKLLVKQYMTKEGVRTLADIVETELYKGNKLEVHKEHDSGKSKRIREHMSAIKKRWVIAESREAQEAGRGSNHNLPEVINFWNLFDALFTDCDKTIYYVSRGENTYTKIPKMVFDYYANENTLKGAK